MGFIVFIIIVIFIAITAAKKQGQQNQRSNEHSGEYNTAPSYDRTRRNTSYSSTSGNRTGGSAGSTIKSRANSANSSAGTYATRKAAERAKENMTEKELKSRPSAQEFKNMAGVEAGDGAILSAAKMHSLAAELGNEFDSQADLMEPVFNLMVTGPDTSIPNERNFVSEGMDMLNSYTLES